MFEVRRRQEFIEMFRNSSFGVHLGPKESKAPLLATFWAQVDVTMFLSQFGSYTRQLKRLHNETASCDEEKSQWTRVISDFKEALAGQVLKKQSALDYSTAAADAEQAAFKAANHKEASEAQAEYERQLADTQRESEALRVEIEQASEVEYGLMFSQKRKRELQQAELRELSAEVKRVTSILSKQNEIELRLPNAAMAKVSTEIRIHQERVWQLEGELIRLGVRVHQEDAQRKLSKAVKTRYPAAHPQRPDNYWRDHIQQQGSRYVSPLTSQLQTLDERFPDRAYDTLKPFETSWEKRLGSAAKKYKQRLPTPPAPSPAQQAQSLLPLYSGSPKTQQNRGGKWAKEGKKKGRQAKRGGKGGKKGGVRADEEKEAGSRDSFLVPLLTKSKKRSPAMPGAGAKAYTSFRVVSGSQLPKHPYGHLKPDKHKGWAIGTTHQTHQTHQTQLPAQPTQSPAQTAERPAPQSAKQPARGGARGESKDKGKGNSKGKGGNKAPKKTKSKAKDKRKSQPSLGKLLASLESKLFPDGI